MNPEVVGRAEWLRVASDPQAGRKKDNPPQSLAKERERERERLHVNVCIRGRGGSRDHEGSRAVGLLSPSLHMSTKLHKA